MVSLQRGRLPESKESKARDVGKRREGGEAAIRRGYTATVIRSDFAAM